MLASLTTLLPRNGASQLGIRDSGTPTTAPTRHIPQETDDMVDSAGSAPADTPAAASEAVPVQKPEEPISFLRHIQYMTSWASKPENLNPYPPISSIPYTPPSRLSEPDVCPSPFPAEPVFVKAIGARPGDAVANDDSNDDTPKPKSVLYLAYGSNLCAKTFLGMRGIRPLSQVNVTAPSLRLTFDLPGLPYREPAFANTAFRKLPDKPKLPPGVPDVPDVPDLPPHDPPGGIKPPHWDLQEDDDDGPAFSLNAAGDPVWNKGLIGVVYEVTPADYTKIVATEGGGASYHEILVPCIALKPPVGVPENPNPVIPRPFLARTLFAPRLPDIPDKPPSPSPSPPPPTSTGDDKDGKEPPKNPKPKEPPLSKLPPWARQLLLPVRRPDPDYAQPSLRYLQLIRDGAREHELPADYRAYLDRLQPYTITSTRQQIGKLLFTVFWGPWFLLFVLCTRVVADDKGKVPVWWAAMTALIINLAWLSYDHVYKPVFGDGERTMPPAGDKKDGFLFFSRPGTTGRKSSSSARSRSGSFAWRREKKAKASDVEKMGLLEEITSDQE